MQISHYGGFALAIYITMQFSLEFGFKKFALDYFGRSIIVEIEIKSLQQRAL